MYDYVILHPSGLWAVQNWTDPFGTGTIDPITGIVKFGAGDTDWGLFSKNLYLADYFYKFVVYDDRTENRYASGSIEVGVNPTARVNYLWEIAKRPSGHISEAVDGWKVMIEGTGNIETTGFISYAYGTGLVDYAIPEIKYWDNYDGDPVVYAGHYIGGSINASGQIGMSVDLSTDPDIDALAAPTESGNYRTLLSGEQAYEIHASGDRVYQSTSVPDVVEAPVPWDKSVAFAPDSTGEMLYPGTGVLPSLTMTVDRHGLPETVNTLARDIAQKAVVYTARRLNKLMRDIYGNAKGYATDIPDATGLYHSFTIQNSGMVTPTGGLSWPTLPNPTPSGEQNPVTDSGMYPSGTPDWVYRRSVFELDISGSYQNGAMPWTVGKLLNLQRRINHLVGTGTAMGSRLLRAIMPVIGRVSSFEDLPATSQGAEIYWVSSHQAYYYYNVINAQWESSWAVIGGSGDFFPEAPAGTGVFETWRGVAAKPSQIEDFTQNEYRDPWPMVPGLDIYNKIYQDSFIGVLGQGFVDMTRATGDFEVENPESQFVNAYKEFHRKLGSIRYAQLTPTGTLAGIMSNSFMDQILFSSGQFVSSVSISGMKAIIEWHKRSVGTRLAGEIDFDVSGTFSTQLYQGAMNEMSPVPSGSGQYIGPHRDMYVSPTQPFFYDWIDGVKITYYDPEAV